MVKIQSLAPTLWARVFLGLGLIFGISFLFRDHLNLTTPLTIAWKGMGVGSLSAYAFAAVKSGAGRMIAGVMALGALGDMVLEVNMNAGALFFLAGHCLAVYFYLGHMRASVLAFHKVVYIGVAAAIIAISGFITKDIPGTFGIIIYATPLALMTAAALATRFPVLWTGVGALLFALSDILIFGRLSHFGGEAWPSYLVWPFYFGGQFLIVVGVIKTLVADKNTA